MKENIFDHLKRYIFGSLEEEEKNIHMNGEKNTLSNGNIKLVSGGNITFEGKYLKAQIIEKKTMFFSNPN